MAVLGVGSGETYTTLAAAIAAATTTDIIELREDIAEIVDETGFDFDTLRSDSTRRKITGTSVIRMFTLNHTVDHLTKIEGIWFQQSYEETCATFTSGAGGSNNKLEITDCWFQHTAPGTGNEVLVRLLPWIADAIIFDRCDFIANATTYGSIQAAGVVVDGFTVKNSKFRNMLGTFNAASVAAIFAQTTTTNRTYKVFNCTFSNSIRPCIGSRSDALIENCLFMSRNAKAETYFNTGNLTKANIKNCAFEVQTDDGGWDVSNIFGIVPDTETNSDLSLKDGSQLIDVGITIVSITEDYIGTSRPQGSAYDIGAYEFIQLPTPLSDYFNTNYSGIPTSLILEARGPSAFKLSWDAPINLSVPISGYRVYRAYTNDEVMNSIGVTLDTTFTDSGVERPRDYFYRVTTIIGDS